MKKTSSFYPFLYFLTLFIAAIPFHLNAQVPVSGINLENIQYPFPVKYIHLTLQNEQCSLAYMDVRPKNANGRTVLLLHGKNFNGAYWRRTANDLVKEGFRVIIPDQLGFGKSTKPKHFQYTFHQLAANTRNILDSLGITKVTVLGHSMGGMVATRFTLMYPEIAEKLVLVNPLGLEDYKLAVPYQSVDARYKEELGQTYESLKKYESSSYFDNNWKPEYEELLRPLAGWTVNKQYPLIAWNAALTYDMIMTQPVVYEFGNIKARTLLIIGQRDRTSIGKPLAPIELQASLGNYPILGRKTQASIPGSRLVELEGVGHLPHIEAYDRFIQPLISFLKE